MELFADVNGKFAIPSLSILTNISCNFQCFGCNVGSNYFKKDDFNLADRLKWLETLYETTERLNLTVGTFEVLGGEPLMTSNYVDMSFKIKELYPDSSIIIYTNGALLHKHSENIEKIKHLKGISFVITIHQNNNDFFKKVTAGLMILKTNKIPYLIKGGYFPILNENPKSYWQIKHVYKDGKMYPANEENYKKSWVSCEAKYCPQLYDDSIWKCARIAYLKNTLKALNQSNDVEWSEYLKYKPLDLKTCTLEEVIDFFTAGPEKICSMCLAQKPHFIDKPIKKAKYEEFDVSKPNRIL